MKQIPRKASAFVSASLLIFSVLLRRGNNATLIDLPDDVFLHRIVPHLDTLTLQLGVCKRLEYLPIFSVELQTCRAGCYSGFPERGPTAVRIGPPTSNIGVSLQKVATKLTIRDFRLRSVHPQPSVSTRKRRILLEGVRWLDAGGHHLASPIRHAIVQVFCASPV